MNFYFPKHSTTTPLEAILLLFPRTKHNMYLLSPHDARILLLACKHKLPRNSQLKKLDYVEQGIYGKGNPPKHPVRIDLTNKTIYDGVLRLYVHANNNSNNTPVEFWVECNK